jgi:hypothetical protein
VSEQEEAEREKKTKEEEYAEDLTGTQQHQ